MSRPACYAPWITTYELSNGDIVPCCEYNGNTPVISTNKQVSLEDRFEHPNMVKLKDQFLTSDVLPMACTNCHKAEKAGNKSLRQIYTTVAERPPPTSNREPSPLFDPAKFVLLSLDYRESNLCNFSCKMCGPMLSSTHAKIDGLYGKTGILKNPHKLQMYLDKLDDVEIVNFLGGEPTLTAAMFTTLKEIRKRNLQHQMEVNIVTNGSLLQRNEDNLLPLLTGFAKVDISISLDVIGDQHDFWRSNNTWKTIEENCNRIYEWKQQHSNIHCSTRTAISWPTAYASRFLFDKFKDFSDITQRWNLVTSPVGLCITQLPQETLNDLVEWWSDYPKVQHVFKNTISNRNESKLSQEKHMMLRHDKWHNTNFVDAFPEFADFYNKIILE